MENNCLTQIPEFLYDPPINLHSFPFNAILWLYSNRFRTAASLGGQRPNPHEPRSKKKSPDRAFLDPGIPFFILRIMQAAPVREGMASIQAGLLTPLPLKRPSHPMKPKTVTHSGLKGSFPPDTKGRTGSQRRVRPVFTAFPIKLQRSTQMGSLLP